MATLDGIKVSQPNNNVKNAPDKKLTIYDKYDTLRTNLKGFVDLTIDPITLSAMTVVSHSLLYVPAFMVYFYRNNQWLIGDSLIFTGGMSRLSSDADAGGKINSTTLTLKATGPANATVRVYYEIFYQGFIL